MKLKSEEQILDQDIRKRLVEEILSPENTSRRYEAYKRYEIYKDRIKKYILQNLAEEFDQETIQDMQSRIATINIFKKMVSKKARVYKTAPIRQSEEQEKLDWLTDKINLNVKMKKVNKYLEAFLNVDCFVRPIKDTIESDRSGSEKWKYTLDPMPPWKYDVVEDHNDPEGALGYIFSHFKSDTVVSYSDNPADHEKVALQQNFRDGNDKDEMIADSPADKSEEEFVWWGNRYHFTFNKSGDILPEKSPDDLLNPIQTMPIVSFARDRDGSFWSVGGEDLVEGSILVNTTLTDVYYIAKLHGTGLFYLFGDGVPKTMTIGPNRGITLDTTGTDKIPTIGFANASPQLQDHMRLVEQYIALLLTTNDLEPGSVRGSLDASTAASGVHEMIIKSEPINSVEDDQELFRDKEPEIVNIAAKWHNVYWDRNALVESYREVGRMPDRIDYSMKFGAIQPYQSESEKLDVIEKRLKIGLDDMAGALRIDNPDLSEKEAMEKARKMTQDKLERQKQFMEEIIADKKEQDQLQSGSESTDKEPEQESEGEG